MFYKGIVFDLDDTIYDYKKCNSFAIKQVIDFIIQNNDKYKNYEYIKNIYDEISIKIKHELKNTASSHNKSIYFKKLIELLGLDYSLFTKIHTTYWESFYKKIECFEGVKDFIIWNKNIGKKIGVLTDYETEYQIIKLEKLGLLDYIDVIVTSEEVGIEKPSIQMFYTILQKMNLNSDDAIMIGDSFEKDIQGSINVGILPYWFNNKYTYTYEDKYYVFSCFSILYNKLHDVNNELNKLKNMSKFFGERFDLVQAGGGNSSIKVDNLMIIKASGYNLTNIDCNNGYVVINNTKLLQDINKKNIKDVIDYNVISKKRGSIETFMHSILQKYTIHLHPIQINRILISDKADEIIQNMYPNSLIIDYLTPGIKVCNAIKDKYNNENVIFLLNHGVIITSNNIDHIYELVNDISNKFESYQQLNFNNYKLTNKISKVVNSIFKTDNISYLCQNELINKYFNNKLYLFKEKITFPDSLIYCGIQILFGLDNIQEFKKIYEEYPKIIIENGCIYIISHSLNKCKEIEDVLGSNLFILDSNFEKNYLSYNEICFLNNWDAEKYRKLL